MKILPIVEGHGEEQAVPVLLRRLCVDCDICDIVEIQRPFRLQKARIKRPEEVKKVIEFSFRKYGQGIYFIFLLDADEECAVQLAQEILDPIDPSIRSLVSCAIAVCEFENWFIAAIESLKGKCGISLEAGRPADPEAVTDAKGWISNHMATRYSSVIHQPRLAAQFAIEEAAEYSRSFVKLKKTVENIAALVK